MGGTKKCGCPYCENELEFKCFGPVFCEPCKTRLVICGQCKKPYNADQDKCPVCGERNEHGKK